MKIKTRVSRSLPFLVALATVGLSGCNRGVGCPTNFSLNDAFDVCVSVVSWLI